MGNAEQSLERLCCPVIDAHVGSSLLQLIKYIRQSKILSNLCPFIFFRVDEMVGTFELTPGFSV